MPLISVTRLRIRSVRFLPLFARQAFLSLRQARQARGFLGGALSAERRWTFWTVTSWDGEASMRAFMVAGSHGAAMTRLAEWCDEASVVHWVQADAILPSLAEADQRMRQIGRPSRVRHPSQFHANLSYEPPRMTRALPIQPARPERRPAKL
ncbi:MAG TPA: DUF3291 domain-containing protein [Acidocella sp.]|jgi:hypothetical protein|nr:DUF3291 domain-containing protein [Acidocella sp.]